jgi:hypothetical protein
LTVVAFVALLALSGAARVGLAGTTASLTPKVTVLNDQSALVLGTPTPGKNIGYDLNISNQSTNTFNHLAFTDTIGSKATVVYVSAPSNVDCSGSMGKATLSCTSTQVVAGATFDVIVLFQTDPNGSGTITNTFAGTYAPESQNTTNQRTPSKTFSVQTPRDYADSLSDTYAQSLALPTDSLSAGGSGQSSSVTMPPGFLNSNNYVGTTLQNLIGSAAGCTTCLTYQTNVVMPLASTFVPANGNPFWTGLIAQPIAQPFQVQIRIPGGALPSGFKPTGVWHKDDGTGSLPTQLPNCTYVNNVPQPQLAPQGICIGSLVQLKPSKDVIAIEWALSNGSYWIG